MDVLTPEVVVDCLMEGVRRKLQSLRAPKAPVDLPTVSFPIRGGRPPLGLVRRSNRWVLNAQEIYAIALANQWYKEGLTLKAIGRKLADYGIRSRGGGVYSPASVLYELLKKARVVERHTQGT